MHDFTDHRNTSLRDAARVGVSRLRGTLASWTEVARQRRQLALLDERTPSDLGISRADARRESSRPFRDLPSRYRDRPVATRNEREPTPRPAGRPMAPLALGSGRFS